MVLEMHIIVYALSYFTYEVFIYSVWKCVISTRFNKFEIKILNLLKLEQVFVKIVNIILTLMLKILLIILCNANILNIIIHQRQFVIAVFSCLSYVNKLYYKLNCLLFVYSLNYVYNNIIHNLNVINIFIHLFNNVFFMSLIWTFRFLSGTQLKILILFKHNTMFLFYIVACVVYILLCNCINYNNSH